MNCQFCNNPCRYRASAYDLCTECKVFFHKTKQQIVFRPNSSTYWYWLYIDLEEDQTIVECQRDPNDMSTEDQEDSYIAEPKQLLKIKPAMKGVTPQNMYDKLQTLLTFS